MLSTREDLRGKGYGTALIRTLEQRVVRKGFRVVELAVEQNNTSALRLYTRLGYRIYGQVEQSWYEDTPSGSKVLYVAQCHALRKALLSNSGMPA